MPKVIGIDLGTTKSCIAVIENGKLVVIPNAEGSHLTPSIVALNESGEWLVGETARRQAITNPENTVFSIKRFMGRKFDDSEVNRDKCLVPYRVVRANNGDAWVEIRGKQYSPPEISAMILQKLKRDAEAYLGERVLQAVITVPTYFNDVQRQATREAGKIAGLDILRVINASVAVSLAYGLNRKNEERIAVYDLGGGTFDISILELGEGVFEVKSSNGDIHLGGDDFDQRIITWLTDEFRKEHGIDLCQDRMALQRLREAAEKAKKELSSSMQTEINLPFITADANGPKHLAIALSRSKLEQLVEGLVEKSRIPVTKALSDAGVRPSEVNEVVLVGGQTRMPAVQTLVRRIFDREPNRGVNPDEVVAIGAAVQAGVLTGEVKDVLLLDATPFSLGVETLGGVFTRLIERNTTIPTQHTQVFSVTDDGEGGILMESPDPSPADGTPKETENDPPTGPLTPSSVKINILQGEHAFAKDNHSLGSFILDGLPPAPRGVPQIEVTFDIDANDIINVSARDRETNREQKITIVPSSGLNTDQIDRMVKDAEARVSGNKRRRDDVKEHNMSHKKISFNETPSSHQTQLATIPFCHVQTSDTTPARAASWLQCAAAAGWPLPLALAHDLGLLLSQPANRLTLAKPDYLPFDEDTSAYLACLQRLAAHPLVRDLPSWSPPFSDAVLGVVLARLVEGLDLPQEYRLPTGPDGVRFLRALEHELSQADPATLWQQVPPDARPAWGRLLPPTALARLERNLQALDREELRFLALYGAPLVGSPDPRTLLDLLALTGLPAPARLALSQTLRFLPQVSEGGRRRLGGIQVYPEGGYEGLARQGSLESLLPSENAYPEDVFLHRVLNHEALYYGRERPREQRREVAYLVGQLGWGLGGDGQVMVRALMLALGQAMRKRGYDVFYSLAGATLSEPYGLEKPAEVGRLLYAQERGGVNSEVVLQGVLERLRGWRDEYRGRQVLWVLSPDFDRDNVREHEALYRALQAEGGQQVWYVRVGSVSSQVRCVEVPPVTASYFGRWQIVESGCLWGSDKSG